MEAAESPETTHVFTRSRTVRLGDVDGSGRARLDALARYLQDVATDDAVDAGLADGWVLRRLALRITAFPRFRERVHLDTWCSGTAASAAERRTSIRIGDAPAAAVDAVALWVFVGRDGRPARLDRDRFATRYGAAVDRRVSTRLQLDGAPPDDEGRPWPLRATDVDVLDHVNNAISLGALEDALEGSDRIAAPLPWDVEVEYRAAIEAADAPRLVVAADGADALGAWLVCDGATRTAMRLRSGPTVGGGRT